MIPVWLGLAVGLVTYVVWKVIKYFGTWNNTGVRSLGFVESVKDSFAFLTEPVPDQILKNYRKFGRIYGTFVGMQPTLVIGEPDLAKQILVKDFNNYMDRTATQKVNFPIWDKMVINQTGEDWKKIRSTITPSFSSGKLKQMVKSISETADNTVEVLLKAAKDNSVLDIKKNFGAFSLDIIAKLAFALELHSYNDTDNLFVTHAKTAFGEEGSTRLVLAQLAPIVFKIFRMSTIPIACLNFFKSLMESIIKKRESETQNRVDFLQLLLNARKEMMEKQNGHSDESGQKGLKDKEVLDMESIIAQSVVFFIAAYDTTGSTLTFISYCLATNPDAQDKLIKEIDENIKSEEDISFEVLSSMHYLEAVINETLRLYPIVPSLFRISTSNTTIGDIQVEKGTNIMLPIYAMQMDPEYYPEPTKFKPERFLPENKASLVPYSFMPFGEGPRHCIGMRLAMTEMKVLLVKILRQVKFQKCSETMDQVDFLPRSFLLATKRPIMVKTTVRSK